MTRIQQFRAGVAAGDQTSRPVTKEYNAVGIDVYVLKPIGWRNVYLYLGLFEKRWHRQ